MSINPIINGIAINGSCVSKNLLTPTTMKILPNKILANENNNHNTIMKNMMFIIVRIASDTQMIQE